MTYLATSLIMGWLHPGVIYIGSPLQPWFWTGPIQLAGSVLRAANDNIVAASQGSAGDETPVHFQPRLSNDGRKNNSGFLAHRR